MVTTRHWSSVASHVRPRRYYSVLPVRKSPQPTLHNADLGPASGEVTHGHQAHPPSHGSSTALYVYGGAWRAISLARGFFTGEASLVGGQNKLTQLKGLDVQNWLSGWILEWFSQESTWPKASQFSQAGKPPFLHPFCRAPNGHGTSHKKSLTKLPPLTHT